MVAVIATMALTESTRREFLLSALVAVVILGAYAVLCQVRRRRQGATDEAQPEQAAPVEQLVGQ